jgi:hypothetical protein
MMALAAGNLRVYNCALRGYISLFCLKNNLSIFFISPEDETITSCLNGLTQ